MIKYRKQGNVEEEGLVGLTTHSREIRIWHAGEARQLELGAESLPSEPWAGSRESKLIMAWDLLSQWVPSPLKPYLLNLPKLCHHLGTKCAMPEALGDILFKLLWVWFVQSPQSDHEYILIKEEALFSTGTRSAPEIQDSQHVIPNYTSQELIKANLTGLTTSCLCATRASTLPDRLLAYV